MSHLFKQINLTASERSAFGEPISTEIQPVFQLDGIYGIDDDNSWQINNSGTGHAQTGSDLTFEVHSGTGTGSFCTLRSKRSVRYRPGQGSMCRFTAMWPDGPVLGYQQVAGFVNQSDVLALGYNYDGNFGIIRRFASNAELWKIQITTAPTTTQVIVITLNGVQHSVSINAKASLEATAASIAKSINWTAAGWIVDYSGANVFFLYNGPPVNLPGVFSFTSNGDATASTSTLTEGASPTDSWIYQDDFNYDKLDGTGPSGMTIDPSKLNVFQIDFRWLGAGILRFAIEDETTGQMIVFHQISYCNKNITPSLSNPSMRVGYAVVNAVPALGTGVDVHIKGASVMGAIQGIIVHNTAAKSVKGSTASNLIAGSYHHLLTLKNKRIFGSTSANARLNQRELLIEAASCGALVTAGQRPLEVLLYKNASFDNGSGVDVPLIFFDSDDTSAYSTTTAVLKAGSAGALLATFSLSPSGPINIDLSRHRILLSPLDTLSIVLRSETAQITDSVSSIGYTVE
jgi:hypothetical protein